MDLVGIHLYTDEEHNDWITFQDNNFNLNKGDSKLVLYNIKPKHIDETDQTNKTHTITVYIEPENAPQKTVQISLFIKYHDFGTIELNDTIVHITELSIDDTIAFCLAKPDYANCERLLYFCSEYPDYGKCPELYKERIVEVAGKHNISDDDLAVMISENKKEGEILQRLENKYNTLFVEIIGTEGKGGIKEDINWIKSWIQQQEYEKQQEQLEQIKTAKKQKLNKIFKVILYIFITLLIIIFLVIKWLAKRGVEYEMVRLPE